VKDVVITSPSSSIPTKTKIELKRGSNMISRDSNGLSDPFVEIKGIF
jgi:Ca2+-dependent lipid-binding protein